MPNAPEMVTCKVYAVFQNNSFVIVGETVFRIGTGSYAQYSPFWNKEGCPSDSEDGVFLRYHEMLPRQSALRLTATPSQSEGELGKA